MSANPPDVRARLFVASGSPSSERALANWKRKSVAGGATGLGLEVVDVLLFPEEALANRILATPTLIIQGNAGTYRMFGTLEELEGLEVIVQSCSGHR